MNILSRWRNRNKSVQGSHDKKVRLHLEALETRIVPITSVQDLTTLTVANLITNLVGSGVNVSNVQYTGAKDAAGIFSGGTNSIGIETGVVLTSGSAKGVVGPNNTGSFSTVNGTPSDPDLDAIIAPAPGFDAAVLQFDFIPAGNTINFHYVFGSEEYPEFVGSAFNDVFAFFVNKVNVALIPGTNTPVTINNVNAGKNSQFYVDNTMPLNTFGPGTMGSHFTQMDGFTTVLPVMANVNPGVVNHIKLAIEDASDAIYDSWVLIQGGSTGSTAVLTAYHPLRYDYINGLYVGNIDVVNSGTAAAAGPLFLLLPIMPAGVSVANATGTQNGMPVIQFNSGLGIGQSALVPLELSDPGNVPISTFFVGFPVQVATKHDNGITSGLLPPTNLAASANAFDAQPTLTWSSVAAANQYDVWVNNVTTGQSQIAHGTVAGTTFTPSTPLPIGNYKWWVATVARGSDIWSNTGYFSVQLQAPTLLGPLGLINNLTPLFSWNPVATADHYDLWVNNLTTGQSQVIRNPDVTGTSFQAAVSLVPGDTYRWWVATVDSLGDESWSDTGVFTEASENPVLVGPSGLISSLTPTFSWNAVPVADHYDLWVNDASSGQSQVIRESVFGTSFTPATPLTLGDGYHWWVATVLSTGQEYWSGTGVFSEALLPAPALLGPNGQVADSVTFSWTPVTGADHYYVWVKDASTGQSPVFQATNVTGTSVTGALPPGHLYRWWVATVDAVGHQSWSDTGVFSTSQLPAPFLVAPVGLTLNINPTFTWTPVANAVAYEVWVNDVTTGQSAVIDTNVTGTSLVSPVPLLSGYYKWWVASVDSSGFESWSYTGYFNEP